MIIVFTILTFLSSFMLALTPIVLDCKNRSVSPSLSFGDHALLWIATALSTSLLFGGHALLWIATALIWLLHASVDLKTCLGAWAILYVFSCVASAVLLERLQSSGRVFAICVLYVITVILLVAVASGSA